MKASELRLGNIVYYKNKQYEVYGRISPVEIDLDSESRDEHIPNVNLCKVQGIPLTEEWLLKCGFKVKHMMDTQKYQIIVFHNLKMGYLSFDFSLCINDTNEYSHLDNLVSISKPMKYLHQLQNLYYALTGEELEIKA